MPARAASTPMEPYVYTSSGLFERATKVSPVAALMAGMNKNMAITRDFMFLGALVNAYSGPVMTRRFR